MDVPELYPNCRGDDGLQPPPQPQPRQEQQQQQQAIYQEPDQFHHHNYLIYNNASAPYIGTHATGAPPKTQKASSDGPMFQFHLGKGNGLEAYSKSDPAGGSSGIIGLTKNENSQTRKRISAQQTSILEAGYQRCAKPDKEYREELAEKTGLPPRTIQIWFQNRRAKAKSQQKNSDAGRHQPAAAAKVPPPMAFFNQQYTLNPPPPPHQHHAQRRFSHQGNLIQIQNQHFPPGQITSQVIHVPSLASQPAVSTPDSLPLGPPAPAPAPAAHHHRQMFPEHHHQYAAAPPPAAPPAPVVGFAGLQASPTTDTTMASAPSDGELTDDAPLLTPLSSLQSPSATASPYVGTLREKRTPTMDVVPEPAPVSAFSVAGDASTKRRKSAHFGPIPTSATDTSFSASPCPSPQTSFHPHHHHHHHHQANTMHLSDESAAAAAAPSAATLRRSVSASGAMYSSQRYGPGSRMVRHNSSNAHLTTPVVYEDRNPTTLPEETNPTDYSAFFSLDSAPDDNDASSFLDDQKLTFDQMLFLDDPNNNL